MQRLINLFRGHVRLRVEGAYPERFLNICAANNLAFWGLEYENEISLLVTMTKKSHQKLEPLAQRAMCTVSVLSRTGLPFFAGRFRKRYAFVAGMALCIATVMFLSQFLLDIEVSGNELVSADRILTELKDLGVRPGVYGPSIDSGIIEQELILRIPELAYFTLNISGSRAHVIVRERIEKPQLIDKSQPSNVVATKDGVITKIDALDGTPVVQPGSTVLEGELLISGVDDMEGPYGDGSTVGVRILHAMGNVYARTWYDLEAQTPLTTDTKAYTGAEKTHLSLLFGEQRINFYFNGRIPYDNYDKIESIYTIDLPGDFSLPVKLHVETYFEYTLTPATVDAASAEDFLKECLHLDLEKQVGDGEIVSVQYETREENGMLFVTLTAECEEQIGVVTLMPTDELPEVSQEETDAA